MKLTKIKGRDLMVFRSTDGSRTGRWEATALATSCDIQVSRDMIEVLPKEDWRMREYVAGRGGWSLTADGLVCAGDEAFDWGVPLLSGERMLLAFTTTPPHKEDRAHTYFVPSFRAGFVGFARVTEVAMGAQLNGAATYRVAFRGDGLITRADEWLGAGFWYDPELWRDAGEWRGD